MARTYRATIRCHDVDDGSLIEPSLHYQTDLATGGNEPDPHDVASAIWNLIGFYFPPCCHAKILIDELRVRSEEVAGSGVIPSEGTHIVNLPGTLTSTPPDLPRELVGIVNLKTNAAIRSGRGYMTLPGPYVGGNLVGRLWASTYKTAADAFAAVLDDSFQVGTIIPADIHPVVYSHVRRARNQEPYTFRVVAGKFNTRPHWLRSRGTSP